MKLFLQALNNKYFLWVLIFIGLLGTFQLRSCQLKENERLNTYNRQIEGKLSDKERELQSANKELGISKSELLTQKELADRLKKDKKEINEQFEQFKKDHDLQIKSRDTAIAKLKQIINGGSSGTNISPNDPNTDGNLCDEIKNNCVVSYWWEDSLKRFKLKDPNIFNKNDEVFETNQLFKVYGEVWEQKDGSLQTRRLVLREVYLDGKDYKPIQNGKAEIVEFNFEYHNAPISIDNFNWRDLFRLRAIGVGSITAVPNGGKMLLGLGAQFFQYNGIGLNTHTAFDFENISKSEQRIGLGYSPKIYNLDLNMAFGLSLGTPFVDPFNKYSANLDLIFYINN